jgi:hypothetical protein
MLTFSSELYLAPSKLNYNRCDGVSFPTEYCLYRFLMVNKLIVLKFDNNLEFQNYGLLVKDLTSLWLEVA